MSDRFWKLLNLSAGYLMLALTFGALALMAHVEVKDLDLWLHIASGRYIVDLSYFVPPYDFLSCTIAGQPWNNHEWLFQILVYWIHFFQGPEGLITMQVLLVMLTGLLVLYLGYFRERQFLSILGFLFVVLVFQIRFTMRADLFSLLFFALYIMILSRFLDRKWALGFLFLIQVLWTNMHGFFFFGPLLVLIALFSEWAKRRIPLPWDWNRVGRLENDEYRRLRWILGFTALACIFNPQGMEGALYPFRVFFQLGGEHKIFFKHIVELQSPLELESLFSISGYIYYKILILMSAVSFFFNRRRIDISVLIVWIVFLLFSLSAVRNIVFFAFAAYFAFMANIVNLRLEDVAPVKIRDPLFMNILEIVLKGFLIVWLMNFVMQISVYGYYDFQQYARKSQYGGVTQRTYLHRLADFLVREEVTGNIFNDFNSGAYLLGRTHPRIRVFMDGRTEVYGPEFFKYYRKIYAGQDTAEFENALSRYGIHTVVVNTVKDSAPPKILKYLYEDPQWIAVYFDYDGLVFARDIRPQKKLIADNRIDLEHWQVPDLDIYRIGPAKVFPYYHVNRAHSLHAMGLKDEAIAEAEAALSITPSYVEPHKILGRIYAEREEFEKAFHHFRIALMYESGDRKLRTHLAKVYHELGEYRYAVKEFQKVIERFPGHAAAYFFLARTLIVKGDYAYAWEVVRQGHARNPRDKKDLKTLEELAREQGADELAGRIYDLRCGDQSCAEEGEEQAGVLPADDGPAINRE
ncbi:MAG: tetratricopeptide repeat protein [Candidatus Omnitrophota bacterium]